MDKNTLSNYGWVVVVVIVLAIMIALATPFGNYAVEGTKTVLQSFSNSADSLEFVSSKADFVNTSKKYVLPNGYIYEYKYREGEMVPDCTNQISISIDNAGTIYNGIGYKENTRIIPTEGREEYNDSAYSTGFIPCQQGDIIYFDNCGVLVGTKDYNNVIVFYDSNKSRLGTAYIYQDKDGEKAHISVDENNCIKSYNTRAVLHDFAYIRVCGSYIDDDSVISINEEITYVKEVPGYKWVNTWKKYQPKLFGDT